jgi:hypothetical protein
MSGYPGPAGVVGTGGYPGARAWAEDRFQPMHFGWVAGEVQHLLDAQGDGTAADPETRAA